MRKEDRCVWKDSKTKIYTLKSAYNKIRKRIMGKDTDLNRQF